MSCQSTGNVHLPHLFGPCKLTPVAGGQIGRLRGGAQSQASLLLQPLGGVVGARDPTLPNDPFVNRARNRQVPLSFSAKQFQGRRMKHASASRSITAGGGPGQGIFAGFYLLVTQRFANLHFAATLAPAGCRTKTTLELDLGQVNSALDERDTTSISAGERQPIRRAARLVLHMPAAQVPSRVVLKQWRI
jgi:hypothetical protein